MAVNKWTQVAWSKGRWLHGTVLHSTSNNVNSVPNKNNVVVVAPAQIKLC